MQIFFKINEALIFAISVFHENPLPLLTEPDGFNNLLTPLRRKIMSVFSFIIPTSTRNKLLALVSVSMLLRGFLAWWLELGNDEVYYWTYALYPDWSHFDHPPMVGWIIQLFSLNLLFDSELFIRLSSVVLTTANTLIIYRIGKLILDETTGLYAAVLYTSSVYAFVITGVMILPDTPQNFFWMLSLLFAIQLVKQPEGSRKWNLNFIAFGLAAGLSMLSKYTGVFLWGGIGLMMLFNKRNWFTQPAVYVAALLTLLCFSPVVWWNYQNDFVSFSFQSERVSLFSSKLRPDYFATELAGQILYNNPVNFVLILLALFSYRKFGANLSSSLHLLRYLSLPLIFTFLFFSLFRATLPHWTGPAYNTLILLAAVRLARIRKGRSLEAKFPAVLKVALLILVLFIGLGSLQIKYGLIPIKDDNPYHRLGKNEVTLDMYGWRALKYQFKAVKDKNEKSGKMPADAALIGENWFPLANMDYYVAHPLGMKAFGLGTPDRLHKYLWINDIRGGLQKGNDYWYITNSRDYKHPNEIYSDWFSEIVAADTLTVFRNNHPAKRFFVFKLKNLQAVPSNPLAKQ